MSREMATLRETDIFQLRPLITKFRAKLSTVTEYNPHQQIICLVAEDNEVLLRYTNDAGADVLKLISWFKNSSRVVHDVCFDPSGTWLLVLCFDNTLHVVPALFIVDSSYNLEKSPFKTDEITSFVIPFVGPHDCPNSKTCPNTYSNTTTFSSSSDRFTDQTTDFSNQKGANNEFNFTPSCMPVPNPVEEADTENHAYKTFDPPQTEPASEEGSNANSTSNISRMSKRQDSEVEAASSTGRSNSTNNDSVDSFMSSATCPFPLCVAWWQALDLRNRAIIGYSDGSLCFVGLTPNCPFISTSSIENGSVVKLIICKDNSMQNVTLLINSSNREQWKLLLEQKSINYTFPGDGSPTQSNENGKDDWQIVTPIKSDNSEKSSSKNPGEEGLGSPKPSSNPIPSAPPTDSAESSPVSKTGILPAARARLALLKDGAKKFISMKMKLTDSNKYKGGESNSDDSLSSFAIMESPAMTPEILTTPSGPYFIVQNLRNTFLLSALHTYSDTLSVHRMDVSLIPVFLYKIPSHVQEILICSNVLYSTQMIELSDGPANQPADQSANEPVDKQAASYEKPLIDSLEDEAKPSEDNSNATLSGDLPKRVNAVGVISSAMASIKNGEDVKFNENSLLGLFPFAEETIVNVHRMTLFETPNKSSLAKEDSNDTLNDVNVKLSGSYLNLHRNSGCDDIFPLRESDFMLGDFPKINYDACLVVTNKNTYCIGLKDEPHVIFIQAVISRNWAVCEEFCNTFDLSFPQCIEFAGDLFLRRKKITQALFTYNVGRIPPVRTALKLAMFGENFALMQLSALALKSTYILKSKYPSHKLIKYVMQEADKRHCEDPTPIFNANKSTSDPDLLNVGKSCSDYTYGGDEMLNTLQMSASSQFHLSNLLLMTLAEKTVRDKNYFPIWNFIVSNLKFHTNMTSIVLCQSGLYSSALLLAMVRGACFDVFTGLVSVMNQEFGWYSELNVLLYNLSEFVFRETITFLHFISLDYFHIMQSKLHKIEDNVLYRLEQQLNPFLAVYRPIVSQFSSRSADESNDENSNELLEFCKVFIETYLAICIQIEAHKMRRDNFIYSLYNFRINYEDNQFAIKSADFAPLSAGCSHCSCVIDGLAYLWGSNGVPCVYTTSKPTDPPDPPHAVKCLDMISQLNIEVHAVKCGRQHSLILTNNGVYSFGMNQLGQLGVGKSIQASMNPAIIEALDYKNITILEAGQYHNAVVAGRQLYTWGWGVYGQLGHGDIENVYEPKVVTFFNGKTIHQVTLGHAHSMVLCDDDVDGGRKVFVFGSNHFGQLGVGNIPDNKSSPNKYLKPVHLVIEDDSSIRLIHTKFFISFAVNYSNQLYTWGSSPQALRLANQVKKRANAKNKIEESFKREINRRNEAVSSREDAASTSRPPPPSPPRQISIPVPVLTPPNNTAPEIPKSISDSNLPTNEIAESDATDRRRHSEPNQNEEAKSTTTWYFGELTSSTELENVSAEVNASPQEHVPENEEVVSLQEEAEENIVKVEVITPPEPSSSSSKAEKLASVRSGYLEEDIGDHMVPHLVDTSEVSGEILQVSSGLFHSAIISSTSVLYTWGKNLEHQLGTEDKERRTVIKPFAVESIENPMYVECGADFTLVMTTDFVVKAFGGNSSGQCGRDLSPPNEKGRPGKMFVLPTAKRLMRLEGHCVESPCEINLPRPRIQMDPEPTRYLKAVPKFKSKYIMRPALGTWFESSNSLVQSDNFQESEDFASSIENISLNDDDSLCSATMRIINLSSNDTSPADEIMSCPAVFHHSKSSAQKDKHNFMYNSKGMASRSGDISFRHYIHYCLYIFHGLYDSERICELSQNNLEFRIRILMLNYKYIEAFTLCVNECKSAQKSIRIFEYFTKDPSIVPMRRKDLKFFIHQLFIHFISKSLDLNICEEFFIRDLDYYLLELAFVLYFNNNNTELEQSMNQKFKVLLEQDFADNQDYNLEDTDMIFDSLSVRFKALVCQGLLRVCEN